MSVRSPRLALHVTDAEFALIRSAADKLRVPYNAFVRESALERARVVSQMEPPPPPPETTVTVEDVQGWLERASPFPDEAFLAATAHAYLFRYGVTLGQIAQGEGVSRQAIAERVRRARRLLEQEDIRALWDPVTPAEAPIRGLLSRR